MSVSLLRRVALGSVSAAALAVGLSANANAQVLVYGGGATLPSVAYRQLFNCYSRDVGPDASAACVSPNESPIARVYGYAAVGSGRGQDALTLKSPSAIGAVPAANPVPYADNVGPSTVNAEFNPTGLIFGVAPAPVGYPTHHFSGSDALLFKDDPFAPTATTRELNCYYGTNGLAACGSVDRRTLYGEVKQVPTMVTTINVPFNLPTKSVLRLSRSQLCGIFTGTITDWNDPAIRAGNGGVDGTITGTPGKSEPIRVVVRADGSGTTFLFVDHLNAACPGWAPGVNAQPGIGGSVFSGGPGSKIDAFWTRQYFYKAPGNNGVAVAAAANPWTIAYTSPEVVKPAVATVSQPTSAVYNDGTGANPISVTGGVAYTALESARIQNKSGNYRPATFANATTAMTGATPPQGALAADPEAWAIAGRVPDTTAADGYPISGFTWWNSYTCYARGDVNGAIRGFWDWYTRIGGPTQQVRPILNLLGFGNLPTTPSVPATANWNGAIRSLLILNPATQISRVGAGSPSCAGVAPGA